MQNLPKALPNAVDDRIRELVTDKDIAFCGPLHLLPIPGRNEIRFNYHYSRYVPPAILYVNSARLYQQAIRALPSTLILLRSREIYRHMRDMFRVPLLTGMIAVIDILRFNPRSVLITGMDCYEETYEKNPSKRIHMMTFEEQLAVWKLLKGTYGSLITFEGRLGELLNDETMKSGAHLFQFAKMRPEQRIGYFRRPKV